MQWKIRCGTHEKKFSLSLNRKWVENYFCCQFRILASRLLSGAKPNGDLHGAEGYFLQATPANPDDGEILMQYAKLVWELHHDKDRVLSYLEHATQAAPQDRNWMIQLQTYKVMNFRWPKDYIKHITYSLQSCSCNICQFPLGNRR